MENEKTFIEPLFERIEAYGKTSFELAKLKAVDKGIDIASTFISRGVMAPVFLMAAIFVNIGMALWLGDLLSKIYYGFFCVAGFYFIIGFFLYFLRKRIKQRVNDLLVLQILN
jgi:hypothetical protein